MPGMRLHMSLSGRDTLALLRAVTDVFFDGAVPSHIRSDASNRKPDKGWIDKWAAKTEATLAARFGDDEFASPWISYTPTIIKLEQPDVPRAVAPVLERLARLPFELAVGGDLHRWTDAYPPAQRTTFGDGHVMHGWMCAFKGAGHDRLVSRRWLEHGPWKLHRAGDTSLVQFHQLDADAQLALEQARVGHRRMGISDEGGFIQTGYVYSKDLKGDYFAKEKRLRILVQGRDLAPIEMLDACAMKHYQVLGKDQLIDAMAFMFTERDRAEGHLHELWLRGLECWVFEDGRAQRVDEAR